MHKVIYGHKGNLVYQTHYLHLDSDTKRNHFLKHDDHCDIFTMDNVKQEEMHRNISLHSNLARLCGEFKRVYGIIGIIFYFLRFRLLKVSRIAHEVLDITVLNETRRDVCATITNYNFSLPTRQRGILPPLQNYICMYIDIIFTSKLPYLLIFVDAGLLCLLLLLQSRQKELEFHFKNDLDHVCIYRFRFKF